MLDRLEQIENRYEDLGRQLADPQLVTDQQKYHKTAKAHRDLEAVVGKYRELKQAQQGIADATGMLNESDAELAALHAAGVRGLRFNFVKRLADSIPRETLMALAARIAPLGWHTVIYFEAVELPELYDFITSLPTTVVVDHMGRPDVSQPVDAPQFALFLRLMREHPRIWSKVSGTERLSKSGPPAYDDVVPFSRRVVESFPDRVLWGTDWPHPNLKSHMPDDGKLVDFIPRIAASAQLQRQLLVDNPMRLYWND